jgi:hypothetical protein
MLITQLSKVASAVTNFALSLPSFARLTKQVFHSLQLENFNYRLIINQDLFLIQIRFRYVGLNFKFQVQICLFTHLRLSFEFQVELHINKDQSLLLKKNIPLFLQYITARYFTAKSGKRKLIVWRVSS